MGSDFHPISSINLVFKYADDNNLLVSENTDDEYNHVKQWATINAMSN